MIIEAKTNSCSPVGQEKSDVIFVVNSVPDKNGQVRYQRILGLARAFHLHVVTRRPLPVELVDLVTEVRVARSRRQMLHQAVSLSKSLAAEGRKFYIHTQYLPFTGFIGFLCQKTTGCKWVYDLWDHPSLKWAHIRGPMRWWRKSIWFVFRRLLLPRSDAWIIAMHPGILGHLTAAPVSCRLIFSNPGYIPEGNGDTALRTSSETSELGIVYAGLIKSNRGLDLMTEWALNYTGSQKVKLHLIGRHSESTGRVLEKLVEVFRDKANLSLQVHGEIPHAEVLKIVGQSHIGLCPINPEVLNYQYAYPVKIIEYLGSNLIVVATRAHGICSMLSEHETGFTFNYNLESFSLAMEKAMKACLDERSENRTLPGSKQMIESYQWCQVNERLSKELFQIL